MPLRRPVVVLLALVTSVALAGCSGDDGQDPGDGAAGPGATATPTAVGQPPLVEVLDAGSGDRRVLALGPTYGATSDASLAITQQVVRDEAATAVPPVTVPFVVAVTGVDGSEITTSQTYAKPSVDATGLRPADVRGVEQALAPLAGTTSTLVVRRDGTTVEATSGTDAAGQVDAQLRDLVPVLPTRQVGVGASWTASSVGEVDGAVVDQVATYTLESLEDDRYVINVTIDRTYRAGEVEGVEVRSGRSTVTARLRGSLDRVLPDTATGNVSTQVSYVVQRQVTEVQTTVALALTGS
ncbi:hypothetical protein [Nocardioides rubriscoriae]|uniref:hypothetical protein n=1 Tax=Nocardioides rubriscoriae TaxID=642762 RepID=UPI0011DFF311|nr:hypothetical protein [Nocardioides rubriscoriae]